MWQSHPTTWVYQGRRGTATLPNRYFDKVWQRHTAIMQPLQGGYPAIHIAINVTKIARRGKATLLHCQMAYMIWWQLIHNVHMFIIMSGSYHQTIETIVNKGRSVNFMDGSWWRAMAWYSTCTLHPNMMTSRCIYPLNTDKIKEITQIYRLDEDTETGKGQGRLEP